MSSARLFYSDEAADHGLAGATFINYLRLFIRGNKRKGLHRDDDGRTWMYSRYEDISSEHPFWTVPQVGRLVRKLRNNGVILAEKRGYEPETWFAFVDESMLRMDDDSNTKPLRHANENVESTYTEVTLKNTKYPFGDVWDLYGKKVERAKSEALWKKLGEETRALVMAHVPLFVKATPDKQYRQAFCVYLRSRRWEDEELPVVIPKKKDRGSWGKPEVTVNRSRECVICGGPATHSHQNDPYCEDHDQYSKRLI